VDVPQSQSLQMNSMGSQEFKQAEEINTNAAKACKSILFVFIA